MKNKLIVSILPLLMVSTFSSFAEDNTSPSLPKITVDGGKINFTGAVVAAPCAVSNESDGQFVNLGQVATNKLPEKGNPSAGVPFTIKLVGCDLSTDVTDPKQTANYTKASIVFNGMTAGEDDILALTAPSSGENMARNVGLQIFHNNQPVNVNGSNTTAAETTLIAGSNEIPFSAAYVATGDGATAGTANASVNFLITYE